MRYFHHSVCGTIALYHFPFCLLFYFISINVTFNLNVSQQAFIVPDIYGEDKIYLIKNQLLFDEEKLLIYPVFWIGDTKDTSNIKHHSKSCVVKVAARHTDTLHFTIVASSEHEEYLLRQPIERRFKLNYFACDPCKSFQFRVTPTPDKVSSKYIDIDYYMRVESMESQEIYDRFKNLDKHDGECQI